MPGPLAFSTKRRALPLLSPPHNTKLGPLISSWALPAGAAYSCPGESVLCASRCYAKHSHYLHANVQAAYLKNLAFSQTEEFVAWMLAKLRAEAVRVLRVHSSGDFPSIAYIRKWHQIVVAAPKVQFFGYSRSWKREELFPELARLSQLPNFCLWWSTDRETGPAPAVRGIRQCYLAISDTDAQLAPQECDLVFRVNRHTVMPRAGGGSVVVCPPENGIHPETKLNCSVCGLCWKKKPMTKIERALLPFLDTVGTELNV